MKKLLLGIVLIITLVLIDRCHSRNSVQLVDNTHKTATITTADTTFNHEVEVTYPVGVGERIYTAREINGKNLIATIAINGRLKPKDERRQGNRCISAKVTYMLLDDGSMIISKEPDIIAPITEEFARELLN